MDKNKTQALLARECDLDCPHLDISTHVEAASGRESHSADMISSHN